MDKMDGDLIALLRKNGRATLSELAADLNVQRSTVRSRLDRLISGGQITGFSVQTRTDISDAPVRGLMMLAIAGRGAEKVSKALLKFRDVQAIHSTNGSWDLIAEIGTDTLEQFDIVLTNIRKIDEITRSETNLLLSTRR